MQYSPREFLELLDSNFLDHIFDIVPLFQIETVEDYFDYIASCCLMDV